MLFFRNAILAAGLAFIAACTTSEVKGYQDGHIYIRASRHLGMIYQTFSYTPSTLKGNSLCTLSTYSSAAKDFGEEFEAISVDDYGCDRKAERIMLVSEDLHRSIAYDPKAKKFTYVWLDKTVLHYISSENLERMADKFLVEVFNDYNIDELIKKKP